MTRRLSPSTIAGLVAIAAVAIVSVAVLVLARGDDSASSVRAPRAVASVRVGITPQVHAFGDPIVADVVAIVDRELVVPASIQVLPRFDPYELAAPIETDTTEIGRLLRIRYRFTIDCLSEACTPTQATPAIEFPPGRVTYRYRGTSGAARQILRWPLVKVSSRVSDAELEVARWRADPRVVPAASYSIGPGVLATLLLAAALALLLGAGAIAWRLLGPRVTAAPETMVDTRPPLERALALARVASQNGSTPERRKALERVARELVGAGMPDLAARARTLAWAPAGPSSDAVEQLARDADAANGRPSG